ncbi:MAG: branched-chain amino acid ABC transporter permease [Clostridiales Family XIII bacterium]|jgi:branched-chain amino acid transport system permease protein|nr:branched-chain amino acid ABC transporter permease [Clostridiales Family XIII bacterium]
MLFVKDAFWAGRAGKIQLFAILALCALLAVFPSALSEYRIIELATFLMYIIMSLSWTIFSGKAGYISLATAAFYGVGCYMQAHLGSALPLPVVMVLAACASFVFAALIGAVTLRLRGIYFTIFTFGLTLLLQNLVLWIEIKFFGTRGRMVIPYPFDYVYFCILAVLVVLIFTFILLKKSRFGLALDCIGQNEDSAAHIGVDTTRVKILAFAVSAAPVGAVGAAMATRIGYIDSGSAFNMLMSFMPVLMAIFGGMHSMWGTITGAVLFTWLEIWLRQGYPEYYMIIFGIILIVVIAFMPKGLAGGIEALQDRNRRRLLAQAQTPEGGMDE